MAKALSLSVSGPRVKRGLGRAGLYLILIALGVIFAFPLFWTVSSSLKTAPEMFAYPPPLLPKSPQWVNYKRVFTLVRYPYGRWALNTLFIVAAATLGTIITSSVVGYSFARFEYRGRDVLFLITLSTMMLPAEVTLIPRFILFHKLGWINTLKPLWVPLWFGGGAFNIFLVRQFIMSLPRELDEAALIDGASYLRVFTTILLPLCKPVIATMGIIAFMAHWNDFLGPLIYLNSPEKFTISLGLQFFKQLREVGGEPLQHILMAACTLSFLPCIVVFFAGQKYFVQGVVLSGLKG